MSTPFMAEIKILSFNFAPKGWALCNGQLLPINQNQALFALLGTTYGGNGQVNFALPDLRSRTPISMGAGHTLGERLGAESVTLSISQLPTHIHTVAMDATSPAANNVADPTGHSFGFGQFNQSPGGAGPINYFGSSPSIPMASQGVANTGGSQAHTNIQPYLAVSFAIALQGIFPSQN